MKLAICGITGAVGKELLQCLIERKFPYSEIHFYASSRSAGKKVCDIFSEEENVKLDACLHGNNKGIKNTQIELFDLEKVAQSDIIFLCVSGDFSKKYAKDLTKKGGVVIDNSSAFRYEDHVPLIVPEINSEDIQDKKLIANPNCTTAILSVVLYPIYKEFGLKKCIISSYQATSGGGQIAMDELREQSKNYLEGAEVRNEQFQHPIPFNIIPHIDSFQQNNYTKEEMKVVWETRKIFHEPKMKISCTAVRIPTFRAHAESVSIETEHSIDINRIKEILEESPGVKLVDDPEKNLYPMPLTSSNIYDVEVGRIRKNEVFGEYGLDFFICGDQLLKGAALNAVQIAELL
ncbi:aspartate-semialdehyde dehydrogenase [Candidatus Peregrinibacteria bacterium]|jgi:aspartate-semialdehyde dehydrogenase|nr:aspartate-semialdehyde dehydrogenase [Candidatus Peregrinibacteria bacterium]